MKLYITKGEPGQSFPGHILNKLNDYWKSMTFGEISEVSLEKPKKRGTAKQQRTFFGLAVKTVLDHLTTMGVTVRIEANGHLMERPVSKEDVVQMLYTAAPLTEEGKRITLSRMDSVQRAAFFKDCQHLAAMTWGCVIVDPNPDLARR